MEEPSIFENLSPLDHRYYLSNKDLFDKLRARLSEAAAVGYCLEAELALLRAHVKFHFDDDQALIAEIDEVRDRVTPAEVYEEEEKTHHNIRALVNVMQRYVPGRVRPFVHLGATSVDILDTAFSMRIRDAVREVVLPLLIDLEEALITRATEERETPQVGRTHGQHAVPVTFGFALAEYVARLGKSVEEIDRRSSDLRGKLSGAVGAYNATSIIVSEPDALERVYLEQLGLAPSEIATQMVEPEYLLRLLTELNTAFGIIANLADDLRHLQRSEIDEVREFFSATQVGSSTMPQKRNPWNCEHVKSLWKAYAPRVMTFFMDQISEHQRDLTNSASSRFVAEYLAGLTAAAERMRRIVDGLAVHRERMLALLHEGGSSVLAEPAYILLALSGEPEAHERLRKVTLEAERTGTSFGEMLRASGSLWDTLRDELKKRTGLDATDFFSSPEHYSGRAAAITARVCNRYRTITDSIKERLS